MSSKQSKLPAWGGGSGARMASQAAAAKLRTVKDRTTRSASSAGFSSSPEDKSASSCWGFSACAPLPVEEESCPAPTPAVSPAPTPLKTCDARATVKVLHDSFEDVPYNSTTTPHAAAPAAAPAPMLPAATSCPPSLPANARSALELLAATLGAAAKGEAAQLAGGRSASWEEAFLSGLAVGLQLPSASRRRSRVQRLLLAMVVIGALVVLGGSVLLLGAFAQAHPQLEYYA